MAAKKVYFDTLRSLGFGSILTSYEQVGSALAHPARTVCFTNMTEGDMVFSTDSSNATGQIFVPAGSFKLYDLTTNMIVGKDDSFEIAAGTQFYVKYITAPVSGSVYIEILYA